MDEMEFDKTRKSIGADKLAQKDRKTLLNKFTSAGGQVLDEKSLKKNTTEGETRSGGHKGSSGGGGIEVKLPSEMAREKQRIEQEKKAQARRLREMEEREAKSFLNRFFIKLGCAMKGLTPLGQDMVKPAFLSILNLDAKRALMECQILGNDLFANNQQTAIKIVKELDAKNPLLVELLERATELYNRAELAELTGSYSPGSRNAIPLETLRPGIFALLRKLYYFRPYIETYTMAADMAIDLQQQIEKKHAGLYAAKKKKIRQEWRNLMQNVYPGLVLLAQRAEMMRAEPGSRLFEEMLGILEEDRIGKRKAGEPVGRMAKEEANKSQKAEEEKKTESEEAKEDTQEMSKELQFGYKILMLYPLETLRKKHDSKGELAEFSPRDKTFLSLLFFREFEEEYSFILTTPKIEYNITYNNGVKQDYHQKLSDLFEEARLVQDAFRKYLHDASEYRKASGESGLAANYMEHTKRMEKLEGKMGASGQEARIQLLDYISKIIDVFDILIQDMRGSNEIIINKEKELQFEIAQDKRKRLNGKPIKTAIMQAYCYLIALADRLQNGDLYGGVIEMSEEDFARAFKTQASKPPE